MLSTLTTGGVLACLAVVAQAVSFPNATTTSTTPTTTPGPVFIQGWKYDGCKASRDHYPGFTLTDSGSDNDAESCTSACSAFKYAALKSEGCYCGNILDTSVVAVPNDLCDITCPGNSDEPCGGQLLLTSKRDIPGVGVLISLYEQIVPPAGIIDVTIINIDVTSICSTGFTIFPYTETITYEHCGCTTSPAPTIPCSTITTSCDHCGPSGSPAVVTVTVPTAICPTAAPIVPANPVIPATGSITPLATVVPFTGGADKKAFAGALAALGGIAGLLALL